jgi:hypothetical protein
MATRKTNPRLPPGFAALERWVDDWVLADSRARFEQRLAVDAATLRAFYDSVLPQAGAALDYLAQRQLGRLSAAEERLLKLMLALAEVGPAIEWYGSGVPDIFDPRRFPLVLQLSDTAPQGANA